MAPPVHPTKSLSHTTLACQPRPGRENIQARKRYAVLSRRSEQRCKEGTCPCPCHATTRGLYWTSWFDGSPLQALLTRCVCPVKMFDWTLRLFQRQLFIAIRSSHDHFSVDMALRPTRVVPFTAPLFKALVVARYSEPSFEKLLGVVEYIIKDGQYSVQDVTPNGESFLEFLVRMQWSGPSAIMQQRLIEYFAMKRADGIDRTASTDSEKLLLSALLRPTDESNLRLLEAILPCYGTPLVDPTQANGLLLRQWPRKVDSHEGTAGRDPFHIEAITKFLRHDCNFGGTSTLQSYVHFGDLARIREFMLVGRQEAVLEVNFLQQSVLHSATLHPKILEYLLSSHISPHVDSRDVAGITPLMYAAAYGSTESAVNLLRAGADALATDDKGMRFIDYALIREKFSFIKDVIEHIRRSYPGSEYDRRSLAHECTNLAVSRYLCWLDYDWSRRTIDGFKLLLSLGPELRWMSPKGNTPVHLAISKGHVKALLAAGSIPMGLANANGHTPAMLCAWHKSPSLIRDLPADDLKLHLKDKDGLTAVDHAMIAHKNNINLDLEAERVQDKAAINMMIVLELFKKGGGLNDTDNCTCDCSVDGCTLIRSILPKMITQSGRARNLSGLTWIIELFIQIESLGLSGFANLVMALFRRLKFDELGLMHTCCLVGNAYFRPQTLVDPRIAAIALENPNVDILPSPSFAPSDTKADMSDDIAEDIPDKDSRIEALNNACTKFNEQLSETRLETHLIELLARRAESVVSDMEAWRSASVESCERALFGPDLPRLDCFPLHARSEAYKVDIQPHDCKETRLIPDTNPPVWEDKKNDRFIFARTYKYAPLVEPLVEDSSSDFTEWISAYLATACKYEALSPSIDAQSEKEDIVSRRQRLCNQLLVMLADMRDKEHEL